MQEFTAQGNLFTIQYPEHWTAKLEFAENNTYIFYNPEHEWGVCRISAILLNPDERDFKSYVSSWLAQLVIDNKDKQAEIIHTKELDVLHYRDKSQDNGVEVITDTCQTADNFKVIVMSYTVAAKDETQEFVGIERNLVQDMLQTLVIH